MKKHHPAASRYQKLVYWSDEDTCFVGTCPGLFLGGVHGDDEAMVYANLCAVVDEHLAILDSEGETHPAPTAKAYSGKLALRIDPVLHRAIAARAMSAGDSVNQYIERTLKSTLTPAPHHRPARA
jgi:predicted HicB family RNase H-like nuclease